ncbi:ankyrin repeat-containing domain protein [Mycena capillaripes]|nr:ankyrin repeat-containing domain protein [Mycena capillaripes]
MALLLSSSSQLSELPSELILHIASLSTRYTIIDPENHLSEPFRYPGVPDREPQLVPDLPSINALSQANTTLHHTLNQTLYDLCASVEVLGMLAILFAVQHGLESAVDRLVAVGISLDTEYKSPSDRYPGACALLHIAANLGLREMVAKLLGMYGEEMRTKVYTRTGLFKKTALDYAARHEHIDVVRLLAPIESMPATPPPWIETRYTYIGCALIEAGNVEICEYLISVGADPNFPFSYGTPLSVAAGANNLEVVQLLLAHGAKPNFHLGRRIPLFKAVGAGHSRVVQALLEGGADIHGCDNRGRTVLYCCMHIESLRFSLEAGVDPNIEDNRGETGLHYACSSAYNDQEFAKASVGLLLQFGAKTVDKVNMFGHTPVDIAMHAGSSEIVEILEPFVQNTELKSKITDWRDRGSEALVYTS